MTIRYAWSTDSGIRAYEIVVIGSVCDFEIKLWPLPIADINIF